MNSRFKIFGLIAVVGFVAGVLAQVTATYLIPWLVVVLPSLAGLSSFVVAGAAGAVLTVAIVGAWAYMSGKKDPY
jgi:hypothetical protein